MKDRFFSPSSDDYQMSDCTEFDRLHLSPDYGRKTGWLNDMTENLLWTLNFIFGCRHRNMSRPFTCSRQTYEVCLDCGRHFPYSLQTMSPKRDGPRQEAANASNLRYRIE
jgi:hypothetical protein